MAVEFTPDEIVEDLSDLRIAIVHLLYAGGITAIRGDVRFQKEMFLIADYIERVREEAQFIPHIFGPYSESVEIALEDLISLGLVRKSGNAYILTLEGVQVWEKIKSAFSDDESGAIEDYKAFFNDMSSDEILLFVYVTYPEYTQESVRYRDILLKRVPLSVSLYRKDKVSLEKGAYLAGMNIEVFLDRLKG